MQQTLGKVWAALAFAFAMAFAGAMLGLMAGLLLDSAIAAVRGHPTGALTAIAIGVGAFIGVITPVVAAVINNRHGALNPWVADEDSLHEWTTLGMIAGALACGIAAGAAAYRHVLAPPKGTITPFPWPLTMFYDDPNLASPTLVGIVLGVWFALGGAVLGAVVGGALGSTMVAIFTSLLPPEPEGAPTRVPTVPAYEVVKDGAADPLAAKVAGPANSAKG